MANTYAKNLVSYLTATEHKTTYGDFGICIKATEGNGVRPPIFTEYRDEKPTKTGESLDDDRPRHGFRC
jgi:hypothetical protein